jgi:hypothetical protein
MSLAPADDDDGFDAAGVLVDVVALALAPVPVFLGLAEDEDLAEAEEDAEDAEEEAEEDAEEEAEEAEEDAVDAAACVVAGVQVGFVVASTPLLPGPAELVLVLVLARGVEVAVEVPLGSGLGLRLALGLVLGLVLGLAEGLVVLPLLWLPLDDVAGAVVVWVAVLGGLVLICVTGGCVDRDGQTVGVISGASPPGAVLGPVSSPAGDGSGLLPLPSVAAPLEGGVLMLRAEPMASPIVTIAWRAGGTTDRTTPTANTATPTAKAGRSIASRQSLGRCGARGALPCRTPSRPGAPPRAGTARRTRSPRRWTRAVTTPEKASQRPSAPLGRLAWAGRDRILSRIRSRPSAPGST